MQCATHPPLSTLIMQEVLKSNTLAMSLQDLMHICVDIVATTEHYHIASAVRCVPLSTSVPTDCAYSALSRAYIHCMQLTPWRRHNSALTCIVAGDLVRRGTE